MVKGHDAFLVQWGSLDWTDPLELNVGTGVGIGALGVFGIRRRA